MAVEEGADLDYFDLEDLGRLRRDVRRAIENVQRERELYHEIVLRYLKACFVPCQHAPVCACAVLAADTLIAPFNHAFWSLHAGV